MSSGQDIVHSINHDLGAVLHRRLAEAVQRRQASEVIPAANSVHRHRPGREDGWHVGSAPAPAPTSTPATFHASCLPAATFTASDVSTESAVVVHVSEAVDVVVAAAVVAVHRYWRGARAAVVVAEHVVDAGVTLRAVHRVTERAG